MSESAQLNTSRWFWAIVGVYMALVLYRLSDVPPLWYDEIVHLNTAAHLVTDGKLWCEFYAPRFPGHTFTGMPLLWVLDAVPIKLFGTALLPLRMFSVLLSLVTVSGLYCLMRRLFDETIALVTVGALVVMHLFIENARQVIPQVPSSAFTILTLLCFYRAKTRDTLAWFGASGVMGGLAALAHPTGIGVSIAVVLLSRSSRIRFGAVAVYALAACVTVSPYVVYVLTDFANYRRWYSFQVMLHPDQPVLFNILDEIPVRYFGLPPFRDLLATVKVNDVMRNRYLLGLERLVHIVELKQYAPHFVSSLALWAPVTLLAFRRRRSRQEAELLIMIAAELIWFAIYPSKFEPYAYVMLPFLAAGFGLTIVTAFRRSGSVLIRVATFGLCAAFLVSNVGLIAKALMTKNIKPYDGFIAETKAQVPKGARIAAPVHFWLGMHRDYGFTSANELVYEADNILQNRGGATLFEDLVPEEQDRIIRTVLARHQIQYVLMTWHDWDVLTEAPRFAVGFGRALKRYLFAHATKTTDLLKSDYYLGAAEALTFEQEHYFPPPGVTFSNASAEYDRTLKIYRLER